MNRGAILAVDTSPRNSFTVALWHPQSTPCQHRCIVSPGMTGRGHVESLTPKIAELMKGENVRFPDLSRIAVNTGPGSFSGVRTGIATVRALAQATSLPVIGISIMELLANAAMQNNQLSGDETLFTVLSAGENFFLQPFTVNTDSLKSLDDAAGFRPDEAIRQCQGFTSLLLSGNGAGRIANLLEEIPPSLRPDWRIGADLPEPDAIGLALLAAGRPEPSELPIPLYIRPPDARPPDTPKTLV